MADSNPYDGGVAATLLNPLERIIAAAIHVERYERARRGHSGPVSPLAEARAVIRTLAEYMENHGAPLSDDDAVRLAIATLNGRAWMTYDALRAKGVTAHEALHIAIEAAHDARPGINAANGGAA